MNVHWYTCPNDTWCKLHKVNLSGTPFNVMTGVYVIWHGGNNPRTVRVGQGSIKDRIEAHRTDPEVQVYNHLGLYVTWARVPANSLNGVETFLAQELDPIVGQRYPNVYPIQVNLPW